ncbi:MAG: flagellar motor switch protein FliG [Methylobacter sp.]|uniref:flagellar motor switch protein FliG n=1 Tax=Methylobacter sp. TaxID=2051955 RepID=UPI002582BCD1|nr:flagellar motor switch protein FliG [Methylobacter sp.]MCL7420562.1 flagellar motor switch protein FliG [Methylobacter sp.]
MANDIDLTRTERGALLLFALGQERATAVLRHMGPREVQLIGSTMATLGSISPEMVDVVLEEFIVAVRNQTALGIDSEEYIRSVLTNALGADKASSIIDRILLGGRSKGIEQLKWMDTRAIADLVRSEHPQIVAIILSLLDSDQAADIMMFLPENMRSDLLMRIASIEGVQPSALRELDDIMEKQLTGGENIKSSSIGGINTAANILNLMEGAVSDVLLEEIAESKAELAQKIQDKMFVFEDLLSLDNRGMEKLLREVSTDQLLLALRGVSDGLKNKIFGSMSRRAAEMLRDDLEAAPPTKLSEVEMAQKDVLAIARKLADSGEINFGGGGDVLI